jgi:hypothetical protein
MTAIDAIGLQHILISTQSTAPSTTPPQSFPAETTTKSPLTDNTNTVCTVTILYYPSHVRLFRRLLSKGQDSLKKMTAHEKRTPKEEAQKLSALN